MEIDHIFLFTKYKAPEGNLLVDFGLLEGTSNTHPGQGTANRRFYFKNFMLELLWVEDIEEVLNERTKPMTLYERFQLNNTVSPFGIAFRPASKNENVKFPIWNYSPIYLPDFLKIQVAENTPLSEPLYFYLSFATRQDEVPIEKKESIEHKVPLREVTDIKIYTNQENNLSDTANIINEIDNILILKGNENILEIEFDKGSLGQKNDFRPTLPLIFKW